MPSNSLYGWHSPTPLQVWLLHAYCNRILGSCVLIEERRPHLARNGTRVLLRPPYAGLEQMVMLGERVLYYTIHQYLTHYHTERNH